MKRWQNSSYKGKNKYILGGYMAFLILVYLLALHPSLELYRQNESMKLTIQQAMDAPGRIKHLEKSLASSELIAMDGLAEESLQKELFAKVGKICQQEQVGLRSLEQVNEQQEGEMKVNTYQMVLEGSFHSLVKVLHQVENTLEQGVVSSVRWSIETERRSKDSKLAANVYLQSIQVE